MTGTVNGTIALGAPLERTAEETQTLDDRHLRIEADLSRLCIDALEGVTRASRFSDCVSALYTLFAEGLPKTFTAYANIARSGDYWDLRQSVKTGIPLVFCSHVGRLVRSQRFADCFPRHAREFVLRALALRDGRYGILDGAAIRHPKDPAEVTVLLAMVDAIRLFSAKVLIGGPPRPPRTQEQRAADRQRRLDQFIRVHEIQEITVTFSAICRSAGQHDENGPPAYHVDLRQCAFKSSNY